MAEEAAEKTKKLSKLWKKYQVPSAQVAITAGGSYTHSTCCHNSTATTSLSVVVSRIDDCPWSSVSSKPTEFSS